MYLVRVSMEKRNAIKTEKKFGLNWKIFRKKNETELSNIVNSIIVYTMNTISSEYLLERLSAYNLEKEAAMYQTVSAITVNR